MLYLAVCPHDTETQEGIRRWQQIAEDISKILKEKVLFYPFKDFQDEVQKLKTHTYHIYYANLNIANELLKKGYKAVGTYKEERDKAILLKRVDKKLGKYIKIASVKVPTINFPSVIASHFDLKNIDILLFNSFKEALDALEANLVDLALIHFETYKHIKKEDWFEEFISVDLPQFHFFMVHPDFEEKLTKALLSLPYVERIQDSEIQYLVAFNNLAKAFLETTEGIQIKKAIDSSPYVMHIIHKDTIVYANQAFYKTLGYQKEEILNTKLEDYITDEKVKEKVKRDIQRCMKGEKLESFYTEIKFLAKDKCARYFNAYLSNILYEGSFGAYIIAIDNTREKKLEILKNLLHKVNRAASGCLSEHELYQKVCKALVDEVGLKMAWVGAPGEDKWFKVLYSYGFVDGYLDDIKIYSTPEVPEGRGPTCTAYTTGEVSIVDDMRTNPIFLPWKERALKRGYLSSAAVPLKRNKEVVSVLNVYADEPNFFDEETKQLLEQLSRDLSFSLEFIDQVKKQVILTTALENSDTWILVTDEDGNILYVNDAVTKISGYSKEELINKNPRIFKSGYQSQEFYKQLWSTILSGKEFESVFVNRAKSGEILYLHQRIIPVTLPDGAKRFVGVGRDITKEHYMSEEIHRINYYDPVTDLYNYRGFCARLEDILPKKEKAFLILLDINGMSFINYSYGIKNGDMLLKNLAEKLKSSMKDDVVIGRLGGDEFGILIPTEDVESLSFALDAIGSIFKTPIQVGTENISAGYNASVVVYPDHGKSLDELYEHATALLREAKSKGEGAVLFYEKGIFEQIQSHMQTKSLIKRALEERLFVFYYQPYYELRSMQIAGLEALVRIRLPNGDVLSPAVFIRELEEGPYNQLLSFEEWAIDYIAKKSIEFGLPVSVNLSARTFSKWDSVFKILNIKEQLKSSKATLLVELTERTMLDLDTIEFTKIIELIRDNHGNFKIKVVIDDFGTGYSGLSYLISIRADLVKLDKSFVHRIDVNSRVSIFLRHVINLLKALGYETLAEGVETQSQLELLKEMGCDYAQGYLLCKPMTEEQIKELINSTQKKSSI